MAVKLKWSGKRLHKLSLDAMFAGIVGATADFKRIARKKAGIQNTGVSVPVTRQSKRGNKTSRTIYPTSSKPGESPRRRTGAGQLGIQSGTDRARIAGRIGYMPDVDYMAFHELGINYSRVGSQQRPTIVPTAENNRDRLSASFRNGANRFRFPPR